jgi:xanthine dehydrogenase accessory factor
MSADAARIAAEVVAALEGSGPPVLVATVIEAPPGAPVPVGAKLLVRPDGSTLGALDGGPLQAGVLSHARETFRRHGVHTVLFSPGGQLLSRQEAQGQPAYQVMLEVHERPPTLLIVGGGHIGKALAQIGKLCGFVVAVVDDRPEYASRERFPEADQVLCGDFQEVLRGFPIDPSTYIVCVTRGHRHDEVSLRQVVGSPAAYVGMIGSRRRVGTVLQHLVEDGADPQAVARVHTPIGLDIGAETPEEIAVSIMAEIIQVRRGGSGRPMREVKGARRGIAPAERVPPEG